MFGGARVVYPPRVVHPHPPDIVRYTFTGYARDSQEHSFSGERVKHGKWYSFLLWTEHRRRQAVLP
jgi:hypothetical protein